MTLYRLLLALTSFMLAANAVAAAELSVEPDKENVVASRLEGTWIQHVELSIRLKGKTLPRYKKISFKSDSSVTGKIPEKHVKFFTERKLKIYLAGYVNIRGKDYPFVLTNVHGNPHVICWLERDGDPFGNLESFNLMLASAKDKKNDLLFTGGDFNNTAFLAFERVAIEPR